MAGQEKPGSAVGSSVHLPEALGTYYKATVPDTLGLAERARFGISHFTMCISEEDDYEMYWGVQPLRVPQPMLDYVGHGGEPKLGCAFGEYSLPFMHMWCSSLHACQPKCMEAMAMKRLMSGSQQLLEREARMVEVLGSYVGEDGLYWVPPNPNKTWFGPVESLPQANLPGHTPMLRALIIWYQYTSDPIWKERVDRMVGGLDRVVVHRDDYAYIPVHGWIPHEYFRSCYTKRGWKDTVEPTDEKFGEEASMFNHQGQLQGPLSNWYRLTGNEQALRLAGEFTRCLTMPKFWADWEGGEYPGVSGAEHAHWTGHFHGHLNTLRAILEYAIATNDARLKAFVRDGYEWALQGQFSRIGLVGDGQGCGRLIALAVKLTDAGVGDYWEDVDLYIRNHGAEMQFTPEDVPYLEKLGKGRPAPPEFHGMTTENVIAATVGAYSNHFPPYKTSTSLCCSPHGNMGLFYAWDATLRYANGEARINLLLNRASPWMDVDSHLPYEGKVLLKNKTAQVAFVRVPLWVKREAVRCTLGERELPKAWLGNYLRVGDLQPDDVLTIEFPMMERTEVWTVPRLTWPGPETRVHTCRFRGNTLVEIAPPLMAGSPLYRHRSEK